MRRFKWIEWNLQKIAAHGLSAEEVEAAFEPVYQLDEKRRVRQVREDAPSVSAACRQSRRRGTVPDRRLDARYPAAPATRRRCVGSKYGLSSCGGSGATPQESLSY